MEKRIYFFALFRLLLLPIHGQVVISGMIQDQSDKIPIAGVVITLEDEAGETIAFGISKKDGTFAINTKNNLKKLLFNARLLGYEDWTKEIENKTQELFIEMAFGEIELREVVVKSQPMWSREDTLVYSVDAFKSLGDQTIGDVLKRLPGVEVSESGAIKYQGESINRFYIEGLDLLENRYGIATNNVPADAIQNVEIIENHEPMKAVRDLSASDRAAVNLRLKKDKMGRPVGNVTLGSGWSNEWLRLAEIFALGASRQKQYIAMYKTNNTGKNLAAELTAQALPTEGVNESASYSPKRLLSPSMLSSPPIERKRFNFNDSHIASINNLWRVGSERDIRLNVQYLYDVTQENISRNNLYYLPDSLMQINEKTFTEQRANLVDATMTYTANTSEHYLNNKLNWTGSWSKASSQVQMNDQQVKQQFKLPMQSVKNDFKFVKRWDKRVWDITSFAAYASQPQSLVIDIDTTNTHQKQQIDLAGFYTKNSTYYRTGRGNSDLIFKVTLEAASDHLQTALTHPLFVDSIASNIKADYINTLFTPTYSYKTSRFNLQADVALRREWLKEKPQNGGESKVHAFSFADPSVRINYRIHQKLNLRMNYRYRHSIGDFMDISETYIMSNYRNISSRSDILPINKRHSIGGGFQYRNPITTLFANSAVNYSSSQSNLMSSNRFVGTEVVTGSIPATTKTDIWFWQGYIAKYFSQIRTNVALTAHYNSIKGERLQQGVVYPNQASAWSIMPKLNFKISDFSSIAYQSVFINRKTSFKRPANDFKSSMWQITQQLSAYYLLGKKWQFNSRVEYSYNEIGEETTVRAFFADLGVTYKHKGWEYDLSWNNIFNQDSYSYSTYNGLNRYDYIYNLRPSMLVFSVGFRY